MSLNLSLCNETIPSNDFYKYVNNSWIKENLYQMIFKGGVYLTFYMNKIEIK